MATRVIIRVSGGIGNQMFQYAAGFSVAHRLGIPLVIDTSNYDYTHEANRYYQLDTFRLSAPVATTTRVSRFVYKLAAATRPEVRRLGTIARILLGFDDIREVQEYCHDSRLETLQPHRSIRLIGYWQSPQYFSHLSSQLRSEFTFKHEPSGRNIEFLKQISECNAVSLHIRRGDYLAVRPGAVLPIEYYLQAVSLLGQRLSSPHLFVFSDDIPWARTHLPASLPTTFVDANSETSGNEDLRLMIACRHHIIANSTFSWWGAWLASSPSQIVVAPQHWTGVPDSNTEDLHPCNWTVLT